MKISEIRYADAQQVNALPRYDMNEHPRKIRWYLKPLSWILALPETFAVHVQIRKHGMKGLRGGYLLLCNHNSFLDFKVATRAVFPRSPNYIVAIDGFINREELLRSVGCICKRKFISDAGLIKQIKYSLFNLHNICAIYPEARYSLVGTTAILPESLGKMVKLFKVPVVTLICHGNHLRQPVWNLHKRKVHTSADLTQILTKADIETLDVDAINERIRTAFTYDDYAYQWKHQLPIRYKKRAEGLEKVLYKCPHCHSETAMRAAGAELHCEACGKTYEMDIYGRMHATVGETEFPHIPDWYEWEREEVRKEIDAGSYRIETDVHIDSLPNSTGYYRLGDGHLTHSAEGFVLSAHLGDGTDLTIAKKVAENYGVHIEYNYFGKGGCVSFSLSNDTFYLFPLNPAAHVTKFHFAVEELFKRQQQKNATID